MVDDTQKSEVTVDGYIRQCWNNHKWNEQDLRCPSDDIIGLIKAFYCVQMVHLFLRGCHGNGQYWTMNLDQLISSVAFDNTK